MDRSWSKLLLCVILSASIWLGHNLTQDYPETESVTLQVRSSIEGRSVNAADDVVVTARCVTSGFRHIGLGSRSKPVEIEIDPADFEFVSGDTYRIPSANLYKYGSRIFGDGVSIESFASEGISVRFEKVSFRKVPVVPVLSVSYKPQYMAAGPMTLLPDSVGVYGEPGRIAGIDKVWQIHPHRRRQGQARRTRRSKAFRHGSGLQPLHQPFRGTLLPFQRKCARGTGRS